MELCHASKRRATGERRDAHSFLAESLGITKLPSRHLDDPLTEMGSLASVGPATSTPPRIRSVGWRDGRPCHRCAAEHSDMTSRRLMPGMGARRRLVSGTGIPSVPLPTTSRRKSNGGDSSRINLVTFCVGVSLFFSGKLCENPLSFERQSLRVWHQP